MTPAVETGVRQSTWPWPEIVWFGLLVLGCYTPVLKALLYTWTYNEDMGHGFFVPLVAGYVIWSERREIAAVTPQPNWRGLVVVALGALLLIVATLGAEVFLARAAFPITLIGMVWTLGGPPLLRQLAFPLFLLFFMMPIPSVIYTRITFPLQILASQMAAGALDVLSVPVMRDGNILELPNQRLSVVEACSGIRSLLSLTFLSLVYGYFFERKTWVRVALFLATIPIALVANASRVTITGILTQVKPELAEGFFHSATGWTIFMVALIILVVFHYLVRGADRFVARRRNRGLPE